jgi:hypothetical protein
VTTPTSTMETLMRIARQLWRRWRLVAAAAVVAVLGGMAVTFKLPSLQPRGYEVGVATGQILLDTPDSQIVALDPRGAADLGARANVIATLMVSGDVEAAIAEQAGLRPSQLGGTTSATTVGSMKYGGSPLPATIPSGRGAYILTTNTLTDALNNPLPIIVFTAQGPRPAAAARLANAAIAGLRTYLNTKAAKQEIPDAGRIQVGSLGVPQVTTESHGPTAPIGIAVAVFVFMLGCAAIVGFPALARSWRAAAALEEQQGDPTVASGLEVGPHPVRGDAPQHYVSVAGSNGASGPSEDRFAAAPQLMLQADPEPQDTEAAGSTGWRSDSRMDDEEADDRFGAVRGPSAHRNGPQPLGLTAELAAARADREGSNRERSGRRARAR